MVYQLRTDGDLPFRHSGGPVIASSTDLGAESDSSTMHFSISCLPDVEHACASAENVGQSAFTIESAAATEKSLSAKTENSPVAWVTTTLNYERVRLVRPDFRVAGGLGSSALVAVTRTGSTAIPKDCLLTLACLGSRPRVSWPKSGSGASLWAATSSVQAIAGSAPGAVIPALDDIAGGSAIVTAIKGARKPAPIEAISNLTQVRLLDAAVLLGAQVKAIGPKGVTVGPTDAPPLSFVLVVSGAVNAKQATQLVSSLTKAFAADGFDEPLNATKSTLPDPGLANEIAQRLQ